MELRTTLEELPHRLESLNKPGSTPVLVVIGEPVSSPETNQTNSSQYLFLNDEVWDAPETPSDLAKNHDFYLYDESTRL